MKITIKLETTEICKLLTTLSNCGLSRDDITKIDSNNIEATGRNLNVKYSSDEGILDIEMKTKVVNKIIEFCGLVFGNIHSAIKALKMMSNNFDEEFDDVKTTYTRSTLGTKVSYVIGAWNPRNPTVDTMWVGCLDKDTEIAGSIEANFIDCRKFNDGKEAFKYINEHKEFKNKNNLSLGVFSVRYKSHGDEIEIIEKNFVDSASK